MNKVHQLPSLSLGDAVRLFGVTARALRFYEDKGLIAVSRNRLNVRCYDQTARRRLAWISKLRRAGVSLPDIQEVLTAADCDGQALSCALSKLRERRAVVSAELSRIDEVVGDLGSLDETMLTHERYPETVGGVGGAQIGRKPPGRIVRTEYSHPGT